MKITEKQLRKIIREEIRDFGNAPDPQAVHDAFLMWRDASGSVPLQKLAAELGVQPHEIDWVGTGLRVIDGVVTELL